MKHKHCEVIKAWADGAKIQYRVTGEMGWNDIKNGTPMWALENDYRVKPEKKELWVRLCRNVERSQIFPWSSPINTESAWPKTPGLEFVSEPICIEYE